MKPEYALLHQEMLLDMQRCLQLKLSETEGLENCFWIGNNYWAKLKNLVKDKLFDGEQEEIELLREVKPYFTMYIEYFALLAESLQFVPANLVSSGEYSYEEAKRLSRFCSKNQTFICYIESGTGGGWP